MCIIFVYNLKCAKTTLNKALNNRSLILKMKTKIQKGSSRRVWECKFGTGESTVVERNLFCIILSWLYFF